MADLTIPRRPQSIDIKIPTRDKNCIEYAVAFGAKNDEAFLLFFPEYRTLDGRLNDAGKAACRDFFRYSKNKEYRDAYTEYYEAFMGKRLAESDTAEVEVTEERKSKAIKLLVLQLIAMIEDGRIDDPEMLKLAADLSVKLKFFKGEEERVIPPIRVLVERCSRCRYRVCVESSVVNGEMLDMCEYCKARKIAEENGFKFDSGKDLLDLPQEIVDEIVKNNDVSMEDILSGKVDN